MQKYVKLFNQFCDFVKSAGKSMTDTYERKFTNLILNNFDEVADAGTSQGKRGILINNLIQKYGKDISDVLLEFEDANKKANYPFERLARLEVEHFRGFARKEIILFDKNYTFVYGPNGSGKSSFCEALEYSLLGYIDEAINRRIEIAQYIRNDFTGRGSKPKLVGVTHEGKETLIKPDPGEFHFSFIEKNRIEDFGRISANTPNERQNLLAALFGLSEFNDFVSNFTRNIEHYLDIIGKAGEELKTKSAGIQVQRENIQKAKNTLADLEQTKAELSKAAELNLDFLTLERFINGDENKEGRLSTLNRLLSGSVPSELIASTTEGIEKELAVIAENIKDAQKLYHDYEKNRDKIRFRILYSATIELQNVSAGKCPVCETPIGQSAKHPFDNAKEKLKELEQIALIETRLKKVVIALRQRLEGFSQLLQKRQKVIATLQQDISLPTMLLTTIDDLQGLPALANDFDKVRAQWNLIWPKNIEIDKLMIKYNSDVRKLSTERNKLEEERKKFSDLSKKIAAITTKSSTIQQQMVAWQKEVAEFQTNNAALIKKAEEEKAIIDENRKFSNAYHLFITKLSAYMNELPIRHLKELNALTVELYNLINDADKHFEKVIEIRLPSNVDDSIGIIFAEKPTQVVDALHVLSEGHIRCLGLSILLAKNIHEKCPLVIFDDVVNAIDDDHRNGVRAAMLSKEHLAAKQVILTTHAEQFVKELEQHFKKPEYDKMVQKLSFLLDNNERIIRIKHDSQQNYLHKIEKACTEAEWSEALYNSRCCLECLSNKLWKQLSKRDFKTEFSVVIRSPNGTPDLMSVVESMNKFLGKIDKTGEFKGIRDVFAYFLGLESVSKIVWQYLNKGTHEEEGRPEFDHVVVKEVAQKLFLLDSLVKAN